MSSKGFWYFMMFGSINLFIIGIVLGYVLFPGSMILSWIFFIGLLITHIAELPIGMKIGKEKKIPALTTAAKTILFGFTWWLPLKKGILEK